MIILHRYNHTSIIVSNSTSNKINMNHYVHTTTKMHRLAYPINVRNQGNEIVRNVNLIMKVTIILTQNMYTSECNIRLERVR